MWRKLERRVTHPLLFFVLLENRCIYMCVLVSLEAVFLEDSLYKSPPEALFSIGRRERERERDDVYSRKRFQNPKESREMEFQKSNVVYDVLSRCESLSFPSKAQERRKKKKKRGGGGVGVGVLSRVLLSASLLCRVFSDDDFERGKEREEGRSLLKPYIV